MKVNRILRKISFVALKSLIVLSMISCNEEFPNLLKEYGEQPEFNSGSSKVLYIIGDGVRGKAMQELNLPNFRVINRNSLHSFGSLGDYQNRPYSRETGLTSLLTGVTSAKHQVTADDLSLADLDQYPTILSRLNSSSSKFTSVGFTSDATVSNTLFQGADENTVLTNDAEVVSKSIEELSSNNADFIVTHLTEPYSIGKENSFETSDQAYVDALFKFDEYVGALVEAVKARETYQQENWLIVITSSIGGPAISDVVDNTLYGDDERNTITYFYSPKFTRSLLVRPNSTEIPYDGNVVSYTSGANHVNAKNINSSAYNFGNNQDFTISFLYKDMNTAAHYYPIFLSKRVSGFSGAGWNMFIEGSYLGWNSSISGQLFTTVTPARDGEWHAITVVVNRTGGRVALFVDGIYQGHNAPNSNNLNNDSPLAIGRWPGNDNANAQFLLANLQIYNVALTDEEVKQYSGVTLIDDSYPKKDNLVGYWPGYDDVGTSRLTDLSGNNNHMNLTGAYNWVSYSDLVPYFKPPITESFYKLVPNAVDIPFFIYQWFGIVPKASWGLDGKAWTPNYLVSSN